MVCAALSDATYRFVPHPHVITFSFDVYGPGHYVWQCDYPCGTIL
jgi:hypothetical protein